MNKLPVFKTVGQVFGFVIERRFFTLLRLVWFPSLITMIVAMLPALYMYLRFGATPEKFEHRVIGTGLTIDPGADPGLQALEVLNFVVSLVLGAIVAVSIHRLILLDDRRPGTFFYLRLTKQEWFYILAWILYFVALLLAFTPFFGHLFYAGFEQLKSANLDDPDSVAAVFAPLFADPRTAVALALALLLALVVLVRFGLVFPVIVVEDRISFVRSWVLTRGNFWRLIAFWILVSILGAILLMVLLMIVAFAVLAIVGSVALGGETVGALGVIVFMVPAATAFLVYFVVAVTIFVAALSFSYKALAGESPQKDVFE